MDRAAPRDRQCRTAREERGMVVAGGYRTAGAVDPRHAGCHHGGINGAYNQLMDRARRVHRSSILRALHRRGYVLKNARGPQNRTVPTFRPNAKRSASGSRT